MKLREKYPDLRKGEYIYRHYSSPIFPDLDDSRSLFVFDHYGDSEEDKDRIYVSEERILRPPERSNKIEVPVFEIKSEMKRLSPSADEFFVGLDDILEKLRDEKSPCSRTLEMMFQMKVADPPKIEIPTENDARNLGL